MSEIGTTIRLKQVAVEFNVAISTIVEYLASKNITIEAKPTSKIDEVAYEELLLKFQPDKLDKIRSNKLNLTPLIHKDDKEHHATTKEEKSVVEVKKPEPEEEPEEDTFQLKVVGKMNLEDLHKPKKRGAKKEEPAITPAPTLIIQEVVPVVEVEKAVETPTETVEEKPKKKSTKKVAAPEPPLPDHIEATEDPDDKKGLTIVGKLDLEQFKPKKKPVVAATSDDKKKNRKRKRIPLETTAGRPQDNTSGNTTTPQPPRDPSKQGPNITRVGPAITLQKDIVNKGGTGTGAGTRGPVRKPPMMGGERKSLLRKKKKDRQDRRRDDQNAADLENSNVIQVSEFLSVNDLANLMSVAVTQVIMTCMNLGVMVSINQRLDAETITIVADEFGFEVVFKDADMDEASLNLEEEDNPEFLLPRAPIVTIMGHVDHGKTSLLDFVRNANVVAGEAGGITQHIGAYEVKLPNGKEITFLDTPGHEAFTAMRARGAKVTDIAIIVIAADDSVMPQTKEAISHAQAANVPIVFAFNKIDKDNANTQRIREQLAEMNLLVEEWGGKYQTQEIAAKKGLNVELLLEKVLLEAELLDLKADATKRAVGTVVEASLDKGKGIITTVLVQKGTLRVGDAILAGANCGKIKAMFNERNVRITEAGPSTPVQLLGFDGAPTAGDKFFVTETEQQGKEIANKRRQLIREQGMRTRKHITLDEIGRRLAIGNFKELNLIIKGDVDGSVEALADTLLKLSTEEIQVNVIYKAVGQISESDVLLASASDAIIVGFQVRPSLPARKLAEKEEIDIRLYSIIYDAIEEVRSAMEGMLAPMQVEKIIGNVEIRDVFKITKVGTVAGCYVLDGKITRNAKIRLIRDGVVAFAGELSSLKRFKDDAKEVAAGYECGLTIHNFNDIKVGDIIEAFEESEVARKL
ncbi:MAG: translation initiation factor IF-2 [Bacteroidetes bacterium]|nr:translation initiation factor IF-2 [Bacteroidota bacterium]